MRGNGFIASSLLRRTLILHGDGSMHERIFVLDDGQVRKNVGLRAGEWISYTNLLNKIGREAMLMTGRTEMGKHVGSLRAQSRCPGYG